MSAALLIAATAADGGPLDFPNVDYSAIFPQLVLAGGALLLLLVSSMLRDRSDVTSYAWYSVLVGTATIAASGWLWDDVRQKGPVSTLDGAIVFDRFSLFFAVLVGASVALSSLVSHDWLYRHKVKGPEYFVLMLFSASGAVMMASANDLIVVFLGLEILSIALYVLAAFNRRSEGSREAAMKYFILGGFASAILLYGIALTYGATGTTNLSGIDKFLSENTLLDNGLLMAGTMLMAVGFLFKVAAAPFHQWTPDVYEGSPSPVAGFMATAAKAGAFAAFLRIFSQALFTQQQDWQPALIAVTIVTLLVGCVVACVQQNVKRMLAYSSINHAGFILLGLLLATANGAGAALFYLLVYTFLGIGSFAVVSLVGGYGDSNHSLDAYRGLAKRQPLLAAAFSVLLFAQAGLPLTSGFLAKFYVMAALAEKGWYALAVFAMITAGIAAFFYIRMIVLMYSPQPDAVTADHAVTLAEVDQQLAATSATRSPAVNVTTSLALAVTVGLTVLIGVLPQDTFDVIDFARQAAKDIF